MKKVRHPCQGQVESDPVKCAHTSLRQPRQSKAMTRPAGDRTKDKSEPGQAIHDPGHCRTKALPSAQTGQLGLVS